jgi:ubiquinone biosynthesis protein COQ9
MLNAPIDPMLDQLLDAALPHVAFDGWSPVAFDAAVRETGVNPAHAKTLCPRGAVDLAVAYHKRGDAAMLAALKEADLSDMRFRDKVSHAIRLRLSAVDDKEAGAEPRCLPCRIWPLTVPSLFGGRRMPFGPDWVIRPAM